MKWIVVAIFPCECLWYSACIFSKNLLKFSTDFEALDYDAYALWFVRQCEFSEEYSLIRRILTYLAGEQHLHGVYAWVSRKSRYLAVCSSTSCNLVAPFKRWDTLSYKEKNPKFACSVINQLMLRQSTLRMSDTVWYDLISFRFSYI